MKTKKDSAQWRTYTFICSYVDRHNGRFPTHRTIAKALGHNSTSMVRYYLTGLVEDGLLSRYTTGRCHRYFITGQIFTLPGVATRAAYEWQTEKEAA